jgi:starch synthase
MNHRVLFVTPEIAPLNKVGGLGDVSHGLVQALRREGWDVRVLVPGYEDVQRGCHGLAPVATVMDGDGREGHLLEGRARELDVPLFVADFPDHFDDCASPYGGWDGDTSADARRFLAFAHAAVAIAQGMLPRWRPEVVHCNDWTTGLIPALLWSTADRPATVFTIHNLAHQGLFSRASFDDLGLPPELWHMDGLEFYGQMSFIKGGLAYADRINTVSPTYAGEILSAAFGCGLEGLLQHRRHRLSGILNGIDRDAWDPANDPTLPCPFSADALAGKQGCKADLQARLGLVVDSRAPVIGLVSRLAAQKGIDLLIEAWERILALGAQIVVLGAGDPALESTLSRLSTAQPGRCAVRVSYDEGLAHRIFAGADLLLIPSRFEPCGLTQMYGLRYGTVPIAARTGGLVDTVVDVDAQSLAQDRATGFLFQPGAAASLLDALATALRHFHGEHWHRIQRAGMRADFGWPRSARQYGTLYQQALLDRSAGLA